MEPNNTYFFERKTTIVAKELLGKTIYVKTQNKLRRAIITETEAYHGIDDLACHCSKGITERTKIMFDESGYIYIYLIYGMYYMLNIVTMPKGFPAAVLIRTVDKPEIKIDNNTWKKSDKKTNGPGKLTRFFQIDKKFNYRKLSTQTSIWIKNNKINIKNKQILTGKRIGIEYAKHSKNLAWRFTLTESPK